MNLEQAISKTDQYARLFPNISWHVVKFSDCLAGQNVLLQDQV